DPALTPSRHGSRGAPSRQTRLGREAARPRRGRGSRARRCRRRRGPGALRRRDVPLRPARARDEAHHRRRRPGRRHASLLRAPRHGADAAGFERVVDLRPARPLHPLPSGPAPGHGHPAPSAHVPAAGRRRHGGVRPRAGRRRVGTHLPELAAPGEDRKGRGGRPRAHARLRGTVREAGRHPVRLHPRPLPAAPLPPRCGAPRPGLRVRRSRAGAARPRRAPGDCGGALRRLRPRRRRAAHERRAVAPGGRGARAGRPSRHARRRRVVVSGGEARRRIVPLLALAAGLSLLGWLLHHTGFEPVWERLRVLGWAAPLVFVPYLVTALIDARGWRFALPPAARARIPLPGLMVTRMAGEAVNSLTPAAALGEPVKAYLLRPWGVTGSEALASVVISKTALIASQSLFTALGIVALLARIGRPQLALGWLVVLVTICVLFTIGLVWVQPRGPRTPPCRHV